MKNKIIRNCNACGELKEMTKEHTVPWYFIGFINPGTNMEKYKQLKNILNSETNIQYTLCKECNSRKSKFLDFQNPITKTVLTQIHEVFTNDHL